MSASKPAQSPRITRPRRMTLARGIALVAKAAKQAAQPDTLAGTAVRLSPLLLGPTASMLLRAGLAGAQSLAEGRSTSAPSTAPLLAAFRRARQGRRAQRLADGENAAVAGNANAPAARVNRRTGNASAASRASSRTPRIARGRSAGKASKAGDAKGEREDLDTTLAQKVADTLERAPESRKRQETERRLLDQQERLQRDMRSLLRKVEQLDTRSVFQ